MSDMGQKYLKNIFYYKNIQCKKLNVNSEPAEHRDVTFHYIKTINIYDHQYCPGDHKLISFRTEQPSSDTCVCTGSV